MPKSRSSLTAKELVGQLENDSDYQAKVAEQRRLADELARICAEDERELIDQLRVVGVNVDSVWDFVPRGGAPSPAIPVLTSHLNQAHHPRVWEGIVRALSTKEARPALPSLIDAYRAENAEERRWVLANAIGSIAHFKEVSDLPGIQAYRTLFGQSRKPPHRAPAV